MFLALIAGLLIAGAIHARARRPAHSGYTPELMLVYALAGYCGIVQIGVACAMLVVPERVAAAVGVPPGNPIQIWTAFLLLGAGIIATLTIRFRGDFLIAPVVVWSVFFVGASYAHLHTDAINGHAASAARTAWIIATHGLVSAVLILLWILYRRELSKRVNAVNSVSSESAPDRSQGLD